MLHLVLELKPFYRENLGCTFTVITFFIRRMAINYHIPVLILFDHLDNLASFRNFWLPGTVCHTRSIQDGTAPRVTSHYLFIPTMQCFYLAFLCLFFSFAVQCLKLFDYEVWRVGTISKVPDSKVVFGFLFSSTLYLDCRVCNL